MPKNIAADDDNLEKKDVLHPYNKLQSIILRVEMRRLGLGLVSRLHTVKGWKRIDKISLIHLRLTS